MILMDIEFQKELFFQPLCLPTLLIEKVCNGMETRLSIMIWRRLGELDSIIKKALPRLMSEFTKGVIQRGRVYCVVGALCSYRLRSIHRVNLVDYIGGVCSSSIYIVVIC